MSRPDASTGARRGASTRPTRWIAHEQRSSLLASVAVVLAAPGGARALRGAGQLRRSATGAGGTGRARRRRHLPASPRDAPRRRPTTGWAPATSCAIEVYKDPQLSQSLQVRPTARSRCRSSATSRRAACTPLELRDRLATALKEYITNPVVTVIVVEAVAPNVYVMGEVNKPGPLRDARAR